MRKPFRLAAVSAAALLCSVFVAPGAAEQPVAPMQYDDALAAVRVPGFAGVWVERGELLVLLTQPDATSARRARSEVARVLNRPDVIGMPIRPEAARWSFRQLKSWYDGLLPELLPELVSADIDERANVLRFAVADPATSPVSTLLARHGVPAAAVVVERAEPQAPTSLDDPHRPLAGGLRIDFTPATCTLGFPASSDGVKGFVTNSHCSLVQGMVDGTEYYQTRRITTNGVEGLVARETADPPYGTARTRASDAAFATLVDEADYTRGLIARPAVAGTIAWNGTDYYHITSKRNPIGGETVYKVGQTTGRTSAPVTTTCGMFTQRLVDVAGIQAGSKYSFTCQGSANYGADFGDSGSPVFAITAGNDVALVGINWGNSAFSPITNIESELGVLEVCYAGGC